MPQCTPIQHNNEKKKKKRKQGSQETVRPSSCRDLCQWHKLEELHEVCLCYKYVNV
jgi:hypothetical protein